MNNAALTFEFVVPWEGADHQVQFTNGCVVTDLVTKDVVHRFYFLSFGILITVV